VTAAQKTCPIRDLSEEDFAEHYDGDRFSATVLANRLRYSVRMMCSNLLHIAFSPILRDFYDFGAIVSGPPELDYPMCAVSDSLLSFTGTMADAVRNAVEEYGADELEPGDVLMVNDPYRAGTHVNDLCVIRPVFFEGRIVSFVVIRAHQLDMGGITPAGFSGTKRNVYETGLVIPPMLLFRRDRPVKPAFNLILDNARFGAMLLPDLKSLYQSLLLGERLLLQSVERYGVKAFLGSMRYVCDVSAESISTALASSLADGVYTAEEYLDADGVDDSMGYRIKLAIRKAGDRIEVDFSGTSQQARTSINCGPFDMKSSVGVALKLLFDKYTPYTSGTYRNIDIVMPPGTFLSATPPDGPIFLYWEASMPVVNAILKALKDHVGEEAIAGDCGSPITHNGGGRHPDGSPWVTIGQGGGEHGPWGGTRIGDGDSYQMHCMTNNMDPAVEVVERDVPIVIMRGDYVVDSAGAGFNRGGAAVLKDTLWLTEAQHRTMMLHVKTRPGYGALGGEDGTLAGCWLFEGEAYNPFEKQALLPTDSGIYSCSTPVSGVIDPQSKVLDEAGEYQYFGRHPIWNTTPNSIFRYISSSGGGWGNPLERDPERVKRDVRDEYVSVAGALADYGVVIVGNPRTDPEGIAVDHAATAAERARRGVMQPAA